MMTALRISPLGRRPEDTSPDLRVSAYERAASWLLAWLLLAGAVASCLFVVWLGMQGALSPSRSVSATLVQVRNAGSQGEIGQDMSLVWPSADEAAAESDLSEPEFKSLLQTVIDAATIRAAQLGDEPSLEDEPHGRDGKEHTASAAGSGEGNGPAGIPPHLRWEIDWGGADTLEVYARKLDSYGIELGAYGVPGPGQVTYVSHLSRPHPQTRVGASGTDKRLYMSWRGGARKEADRGLAAKAGVSSGKILLQFFPRETEELLLRIEHDFRNRDAATIRKTRFGLRPSGSDDYEFFVIEQRYL